MGAPRKSWGGAPEIVSPTFEMLPAPLIRADIRRPDGRLRHQLIKHGGAGFTLRRALFGKKSGSPSPGAADPIIPGKKTGDLFSHHCRFYSFHSFTRVSPIISGMQKICRSSCGAPFCGAPVRPNMLNMPKSARPMTESPGSARVKAMLFNMHCIVMSLLILVDLQILIISDAKESFTTELLM